MQQRPVGIVLSAIALGLVAFVFLLLSLGGIVTVLGGSHLAAAGGSPLPPAALLTAIMFGLTLVYLGLAGWSIATLVGLLRIRSWARISTMVIAAGLAGLGLLSALSMMVMQSAVASGNVPIPPNVPPALFHRILVVMAAASLVVTGLAVAWLVYLAQRRTSDAFMQAAVQLRAAQQHAEAPAYAYPPAGMPSAPAAASLRAPDPLTDFTIARPLNVPAAAPPPPLQPALGPYDNAAQPWPNPASGWPAYPAPQVAPPVRVGRPLSITVLAILALVGAFFSLSQVVSPFPVFIFGMVLRGWPVHVFGVVWAAALAIAGLGMLRLRRPAWLLSFVLLGFSVLNFLVLLLPSARAHYVSYMQQVQQGASMGLPQPSVPQGVLTASIALGMFFGLAVIVFAGVLLWRARWAFPPVPPTATNEPQAD